MTKKKETGKIVKEKTWNECHVRWQVGEGIEKSDKDTKNIIVFMGLDLWISDTVMGLNWRQNWILPIDVWKKHYTSL